MSSVVSDTADLSAPRGARVVRLRQPDQREQESGQNAEKEDFFHIFPIFGRTVLQQISISEFKLPKGALSIIEEEFGFVKEGFDAVPFGLRNRLAAVCGF